MENLILEQHVKTKAIHDRISTLEVKNSKTPQLFLLECCYDMHVMHMTDTHASLVVLLIRLLPIISNSVYNYMKVTHRKCYYHTLCIQLVYPIAFN